MLAAIAGALVALGLVLVVHGLIPPHPTLANRIAAFDDDALVGFGTSAKRSGLAAVAVSVLETVKGDKLDGFRSDVAVAGIDYQDAALEKLRTAGAGSVLLGALAWVLGWVSNPIGLLFVAVLGAVAGYSFFDLDLKKKADERRVEFARALTAFVTLLGSSIAGGGGITTALSDTSAMGSGWVFDHIRDRLDLAALKGASPWAGLERLGRELKVVPLVELASALTLAGASGARVTDTLVARAEAARAKELSETRAAAEAASSKLGIPVGLMMFGLLGFLGFPAVSSLIGTG